MLLRIRTRLPSSPPAVRDFLARPEFQVRRVHERWGQSELRPANACFCSTQAAALKEYTIQDREVNLPFSMKSLSVFLAGIVLGLPLLPAADLPPFPEDPVQ